MMTQHIAPLLFKAMIALVPLNYHYNENPTIVNARYESIADDIAAVVPHNSVFDNDAQGIKMGVFLVIISSTESRWEKDVDTCVRGGDHNTSWTIFQLTQFYAPKTQVCRDRKVAVAYAIKFIKQSFQACHYLSYYSRLSAYDSGRCINGESISVRRLRKLDKLLHDYKTDIDAL